MYGYSFRYYKTDYRCNCDCIKNALKVLTFLANVTGFVFLCLLVKYSSNDDDDFDEIHGLSIALLVILCVYLLLSSIFMYFHKKSYSKKRRNTDVDKLKTCCHAFAIIQIIVDAIGQLDNLIPEKEQYDKNIYVYSH